MYTSAASLTQMSLAITVPQPCHRNMPDLACLRDVRDTWSPVHGLDIPVCPRLNHVSRFSHKLWLMLGSEKHPCDHWSQQGNGLHSTECSGERLALCMIWALWVTANMEESGYHVACWGPHTSLGWLPRTLQNNSVAATAYFSVAKTNKQKTHPQGYRGKIPTHGIPMAHPRG